MDQLNPISIQLPIALADQLIRMAIKASPDEICGILSGKSSVAAEIHPVTNISSNPSAFLMDPEEQISLFFQLEEHNLEMVAIYHSHPHTPPTPSSIDLVEWNFPDTHCLIIGRENEEWKLSIYSLNGGDYEKIQLLFI